MKTEIRKIFGTLLIAIAASAITLAIYSRVQNKHFRGYNYFQNQIPAKLAAYTTTTAGGYPDFTEAAAKTVHEVVHIRTSYMQKNNVYDQFFGNNPLYNFFFGQQPQYYQQQQVMAFGSGVIISEDGFIVTNNHVVQDADTIEVTLNDKRMYFAKIVGTDPTTDLAVIKIDEKGLPFISYGNSDEVRVGEWVLAVGNPYNLTSTVTAGIVSAKARNINILGGQNTLESFIQTDAPVNPGNSGGALVNTRGELVGINAAIASNTGSFTGYAFAIPVNIVKKVVDDIINYGVAQKCQLGVGYLDINSKLAAKKGLDNLNGVYAGSINDNSSAQDAGIKEGDVITKIAGVDINSVTQAREVETEHRPGDKIDVTLIRSGKEMTVSAILKNEEGNTKLVKRDEKSIISVLGGTFEKPSANEMRRLGIRNGLKVLKLESGKLKDAGVQEGFIITSIDHKMINSVDDLKKAMSSKRDGMLIVGIYPNGMQYYYGIGM